MAFFSSQEMLNPTPRAQMLDGFNAGWIDFEYGEAKSTKGTIDVEPFFARSSRVPAQRMST